MINTPEYRKDTPCPNPRPYVTRRERAFKPGEVILGRYQVKRELGRGGMGVVYLCQDSVGCVDVAVKGLPPEVSGSDGEMEDILRNYQLVRALRHDNIAAVTNLERDSVSGDYYLVMDYAAGVSLKDWMSKRPGLTCQSEKITILRQIAEALDYAHSAKPRQIIHRDIKPSNIIVDDTNTIKVLDFGLAAQIRSSYSRLTMEEVTSRSGTPSYKSPEQWMAQPQREASDQYSLGVIAYQMLANVLPFDDEDSSIMREAVVHDPVPEIPDFPHSVNGVLVKVLAKHARDRYESCRAFVDALGRALEHGDEAPPPSPAFVLPESSGSSATSSKASEVNIVLPEVSSPPISAEALGEQGIRDIQQLCRGYRTLLAESASLHQKRKDDHTAALLRRLQEMVRDAAPNEEGPGDLNELIRIFAFVGQEYRKFLKQRTDHAYFMEHRRRALLFQKQRMSPNTVIQAAFKSIE